MRCSGRIRPSVFVGLAALWSIVPVAAQTSGAVRSGFETNRLLGDGVPCLDCFAGPVGIGFSINFAGSNYATLYVNSHGNLSFGQPLGNDWVPSQQIFDGLNVPIIAPFFADNDPRANSTAVAYGTGLIDNKRAFGATWRNQGYYPLTASKLNTFQVILIERPDRAQGDFDIEFNYNQIQWEASGNASFTQPQSQGGLNGVCAGRPAGTCTPAAAGFSYGPSAPTGARSFLLPGSFTTGAFLDGNPTGLALRRLNSTIPGRLVFEVRGGTIPLTASCNTPAGTVGIVYQGQLEASGGRSPYTWQTTPVSGSLPPGVFYNSSGVLTGSPTEPGSYSFTSRVTDVASGSFNLACSIAVSACAQTLSPNPLTVAQGGGDTTFTIGMTQPCPWTATSNASWIRLLSAGAPVTTRTGNGQSTVTVRVEANTSAARSGTITVNGETLTINQSGEGVSTAPVFTPGAAIFSSTGGSGSFQVSTTAAFSATESLDWVTITSGGTGAGTGTVNFNVSAYSSGTQARSGQIFVNGAAFSITQNPPNTPCTYSLTSTAAAFGASGGSGATKVNTGDGCGWSVSNPVPWIVVDAGGLGSTIGLVTYRVLSNTGAARSATLNIAGINYTVTQESGIACPTGLIPARTQFIAAGTSSGLLQVNNPCTWTATSNASWLQILSGGSGSGPGAVNFAVQANTGQTSRSAQITIRGVPFTVTQNPAVCTFVLSSRNVILPGAGGSTTLNVTAPSGCVWPAAANGSFGGISPTSGSGNGIVTISVPANPGAARATTAVIAGQSFAIRQPAQGSLSCAAAAPTTIPNVRFSLEAELTGTPTFSCTGSPGTTGLNADVLVTLNTRVTSKVIDDKVEALLLIGDPATPVLGTNAFQGKLAGNNAVRFSDVPVGVASSGATRLFRIVNLRADANAPAAAGNDITARIEILSPSRPVGITNAQSILIARRAAPVAISTGTPTGTTTVSLPITYRELLPNTFRAKILPGQNPGTLPVQFTSETGYANSATLGPRIGFADNGFRLQITLRSIPPGTRVFADPFIQGGNARADLVAQDVRGLGVGLQQGIDREAVVVNGETTITYEITAADPAVTETLTFNVRFLNSSVGAVTTIRSASTPACGPIATGLPANGALPVPRCGDPGAPAPRYRNVLFGSSLQATPQGLVFDPSRRAPTGNVSVVVNAEISCETEGGCPDSIIRGNFSRGASFSGCESQEGATCTGSGPDVTIEVPNLDQGERVVTPVAASLLFDDPESIFLRFSGSSCTGLSCSFGEVETCFTAISSFPAPPITGVNNGFFELYPCGAWTVSSPVPWLRFQVENSGLPFSTSVSGNNIGGPVIIRYTIDPNTSGTTRNGVVSITGFTGNLNVIQPGVGGGTEAGLRFFPITPCRLLETRPIYAGTTWTGQNGPPALVAGVERTLQVTNSRCGIPSNARAFVLNLTTDTVYANTGPVEFLTLWPDGEVRPNFSTLRTSTGGYVANSAIVKAGPTGAIKLYSANNVNVTLDISGYFAADSSGLLFYPTASCRPVDTRSIPAYTAGLPPPFGNSRMQAQETRTLRLPASTRCQIPAAQAYSMQFTLTPGVEDSGDPVAYLSAWNTGAGEPPVSNLNSLSGFVMSNSAIVPARADGSIDVKTFNATNFLADVNGYFGPDDGTGRGLFYTPVTQCRVMNTQDVTLTGAFGPPAMTPAADREIVLPNAVRCPGLPASAKAWALNVTAIPNGTPLAFLSLWAGGTPWPAVSQLNAFQGQTVSNSAIVPGSPTGSVLIKVNNPTNVLLEVAGYFSR